MLIPNYLEKLENVEGRKICLAGIGEIIHQIYKELKKCYSGNVLKLILKELKISDRTFYNWVYNKKAIPLFQLKKLIKLWEEICNKHEKEKKEVLEKIYKNKKKKFSIAGGKCVSLPIELTEDLAYLIGYICGDGYLADPYPSFKSRGKMDCAISIYEESRHHLEKVIKPLFFNIFNLEVNVKSSLGDNSYNITFNSKIIHTFFTEVFNLPFGKKSEKVRIPDLIKKAPKDIQIAFLQGICDSDGTVYTYRNGKRIVITISIRQTTKAILDEIKKIFRKMDIKASGPYWDEAAGTWLLQIRNKESIKLFKQKINFRHHKKRGIINQLIP